MSPDRRYDYRSDCRLRPLAAGAALAFVLAACTAQAQTSVSAGIASEYNLRGLSLSDGRAVPQLHIDHDTASGWYGGLFVSRAVLRYSDARAGVVGYGGYAHRLASGLGWDAGISRTVFAGDARYNYTEFYAGVNADRAGARLSLAPDNDGMGRTAYLELNAVQPLGARLRLSGHVGLLHRIGETYGAARDRVDLRAAIGVDIRDASVEFGLQTRQRDAGARAPRARALFASASIGF